MCETRKKIYERKRNELINKCIKCVMSNGTPERCESCIIGRRIQWLEAEYADITGWPHKKL